MKATRVVIIDDEALARERVRSLLADATGVTVVAECSGGREAVETILGVRPDLVFLDVQMPDLNGFEVLEAVAAEWLPAVIFVTAYDEYAIKAFDVHANTYRVDADVVACMELRRYRKPFPLEFVQHPHDVGTRFYADTGERIGSYGEVAEASQAERQARLAAEERVRELEAELRRARGPRPAD